MAEAVALPDLLRQAGAVMTTRGGHPVPAHYGSPTGELAACLAGVALADRADLGVLSVTASERSLDRVLARALGHSIAPGGAAFEAGARWCRSPTSDEVLVIAAHPQLARLEVALTQDIGRYSGGVVADVSGARRVLNVLGRRAPQLLADLGVYGPGGEPRTAMPFTQLAVGGRPTCWLLESATAALAVTDDAAAGELWQAIEAAGRAYGLTCAGIEAVDRFQLSERPKRNTAGLL